MHAPCLEVDDVDVEWFEFDAKVGAEHCCRGFACVVGAVVRCGFDAGD